MAYIGKEPIVGNFQKCDAITVVNGQAAYTLQVSSTNVVPESANHMLVSLNGILQAPVSSFTVSGSTLTFASNLATGDVIDFVILLGNVLDLGVPSDNSVGAAQIKDDLISGTTALASTPADTDEFLVSDAGTLKRIDYSLIKGGGKVLQVVQGTHATEVSTTSTSYVTTNLDAAITCSATSSKVLIFANLTGRKDGGTNGLFYTIYRDSSNIGDANGFARIRDYDGSMYINAPMVHLDSPSSTSELTYTVYMKVAANTGYSCVSDSQGRIILVEIGA